MKNENTNISDRRIFVFFELNDILCKLTAKNNIKKALLHCAKLPSMAENSLNIISVEFLEVTLNL